MNIVLLGPPGVGKGTQAQILAKKLGLKWISTGDILRKEVAEGTELGKKAEKYMKEGKLVPDDIIIEIIKKHLSSSGVIFDGFPRNLSQAKALEKIMNVDKVIFLNCPEEVVIFRLTNRRICVKCNRVYNLISNPPKNDEVCDVCGSKLVQREDDKPEVIRKRFRVYNEETKPLLSYYREKGILYEIDASGEVSEITKSILGVLNE